jgi:hypothetical protein
MGFLTPEVEGSAFKHSMLASKHTVDGTTCAASPKMVDHGRVTLDDAIDIQVASETSVGDILVLETPNGSFNSIHRSCAGLEEGHGYARSTDSDGG